MERILGGIVLLLGTLIAGCAAAPSDNTRTIDNQAALINAQPGKFFLDEREQGNLCARVLKLYLDYGDLTYGNLEEIKDLGGAAVVVSELRGRLRGHCLDRTAKFQFPLLGRPGKLAYGYLITMALLPDHRIIVLVDEVLEGEGAVRNARTISHYLQTGQMFDRLLTIRNRPTPPSASQQTEENIVEKSGRITARRTSPARKGEAPKTRAELEQERRQKQEELKLCIELLPMLSRITGTPVTEAYCYEDYFDQNRDDDESRPSGHVYSVRTEDGEKYDIYSDYSGFSIGDCVLVTVVNGAARMNYGGECSPP